MEVDTIKIEEMEVSMRPMLCKLNTQTRADGSVIFTQGDTTVAATIIGPVEVKQHNLLIDKAHIEVYYYAKSGLPTVNDKRREDIIKNTCETVLLNVLYPRSAILVQIFEMEDCGGLLAASMNAVCLALLSSGLSMKMLLAAVHCVITDDGDLVLDPDQITTKISQASLTFVLDSNEKNVIAAYTVGHFTIGQYNDALEQCKQASDTIFQFYREAIRKFNKNV